MVHRLLDKADLYQEQGYIFCGIVIVAVILLVCLEIIELISRSKFMICYRKTSLRRNIFVRFNRARRMLRRFMGEAQEEKTVFKGALSFTGWGLFLFVLIALWLGVNPPRQAHYILERRVVALENKPEVVYAKGELKEVIIERVIDRVTGEKVDLSEFVTREEFEKSLRGRVICGD